MSLILTGFLPEPAVAHALVIGSTPAPGAHVQALPGEIALRFNSRIDHARSRVQLIGPSGNVEILALTTAPATILAATAPSAALAPGAWRIRWQVLAVDGHITRGDIPFTVLPP